MYVLSGSHKSFLSLATPVIPWSYDVIFVTNKLELSWVDVNKSRGFLAVGLYLQVFLLSAE